MVILNNKGYIKTLEALFAIVLFLIAVFGILSLNQKEPELKPKDIELMQDTILNEIENNKPLRINMMDANPPNYEAPLITEFISNSIPTYRLNFSITICEDIEACTPALISTEKVYVDSVIIKDRNSAGQDKIRLLILQLWRK